MFAQANESRPLVPRLVILGLGVLTGWNLKAQMAVAVALAGVTLFCVHRLGRATLGDRWRVPLLLAAMCVFSPVQHDNWVWGMQMIVFAPIACITAGLAVAQTRLPLAAKAAACGILAAISTFSYANGLLAWVVLPPAFALLAAPQVRARRRLALGLLAAWGAAFAACVAVYFWHYAKPPASPPMSRNVPKVLAYLLCYTGSPLRLGGVDSPVDYLRSSPSAARRGAA